MILITVALAQKIKLTWDATPGLKAEGDKAALTQALVNIVKNSFEAVASGSGEINMTASEAGGKVRIAVRDNGPGIPDAALAQKPFYTTKKDGTGLGLATTAKIMADHNGELIIQSTPEQGCRVELVLPGRKA